MQDVKARLTALNAEIKKVAVDFAIYIADTTQPLEERWAIWIDAPASLKNTDEFNGNPFDWMPEDFVMYEGEFHVERGETVKLTRLLEVIEDRIEDGEEDGIFVDRFKESVLAANLLSFVYNW